MLLSTYPAKAASDALYHASASFRVQAPGGCTTQSIDTCTVASCDLTIPLTPATNFSAGTIAITGAAVPITLTTGATKACVTAGGNKHVFQGGETITFSASGADVPAFVATVQAPPELTVSHPAATPLVELSGSEAFIPIWTPVADGQVVVAMNAMPTATDAVFAFCSFPAAAGSGSVPASVMGALAPSEDGQLIISLQLEAIVAAGSWSVHAIAEQVAVRSDGEAQWVIDVD